VESHFVVDVAFVVAGGFVGALAAHALRLPTVAGYLAAGLALGPGGFGLIRDSDAIALMADIGVALLMFAIGMELSLRTLARMRGAALVAAPFQIVVTGALGYLIGGAIGWPRPASVVLGFALALSSTMVVVKLLSERGELHTRHGQAMVAILLVQDLAAVLMVAALPLLSGLAGGGRFDPVGVTLRSLAFVAGVVVLARWVAPGLMQAVARRYSREVFVVMSAMLCFVGAAAASALGFSVALGAFAAGLLVSESHYRYQVLSDVTPVRDLFGMVFFVSLGLLWELGTLSAYATWASALLLAILVGKPIITAAGLLLARHHLRNAVVAGLGLAQIGEFSFLVVTLAWREGLLGDAAHSLLIPIAGVSLLLSPALMKLGHVAYARMAKMTAGERVLARHEGRAEGVADHLDGHVIICGYGRVGRFVGEVMADQEQPLAVIDYDHDTIAGLRARGVTAVYGDAGRRGVLLAAGAERAGLAVIALPDSPSAAAAAAEVRGLNPSLKVIARAHQPQEVKELLRVGADDVVYAEQEASLEVIRHALLVLGMESTEVDALVDGLRGDRCARLTQGEEP
jgi:CPA2 family monovalent cation:H+ antiporter-2